MTIQTLQLNKPQSELWTSEATITAMVTGLGSGKCARDNTLLINPLTGCYHTIKDVVEQQLQTYIYDKSKGIVPCTPVDYIDSGIKECIRLSTRTGHYLDVSFEHKILTSNGYVRADKLKSGDRVASTAFIPEPIQTISQNIGLIDFAAILLSEGGLTGNTVAFTTGDSNFVNIAKNAAKELGLQVSDYKSKYAYAFRNGTNKAWDYVDNYLTRDLAKNKRIPKWVFSLPNTQLARFLTVFWLGDGYIGQINSVRQEISVGLASEGMIDDIQRLLLRFSIVTTKRKRRTGYTDKQGNTNRFDSWSLCVDSQCREAFKQTLFDMPGEKGNRVRALMPCINSNLDAICFTSDMRNNIKSILVGTNVISKAAKIIKCESRLREFINKNNSGRGSRERVRALIEAADGRLDDYKWLVSDNIIWDEIKKIEHIGEHQCYDLSTPPISNFIANNIIIHNSFIAVRKAFQLSQQYQGSAGLLSANSYKQLTATLVKHMLDFLNSLGWEDGVDYVLNKQPPWPSVKKAFDSYHGVLTFSNGSYLFLRSLDDYDTALRGIEIDFIVMDEAAYSKPEAFIVALGRLRGKYNINRIYLITTPNGKDYIYELMYDKLQDKEFVNDLCAQLNTTEDKLFRFIQGTTLDNMHNLPPAYIAIQKANMSEAQYNQEILGHFITFQGAVYTSFLRETHVKTLLYKDVLPLYLSCDFNVSNMAWIVAQKDKDDKWNVIKEISRKSAAFGESPTESAAREFLSEFPSHKANIIVTGDASGQSSSTKSNQTDYDIIKEVLRTKYKKVALSIRDSNPSVVDRINKVNAAFKSVSGDIKIYIDKCCKNLIKDIEQVKYKEGSRKVDDRDSDRTHFTDALGYLIYGSGRPTKAFLGGTIKERYDWEN